MGTEWYTGTANAIYQNLAYMEQYKPDYVLILSGDHIYKMDYESMLDFHKETGAEVTIAVMPVPMEEASRFGIMITDDDRRVTDFEEKPRNPRSNLASMGIYIFSWKTLRESPIANSMQPGLDFGKHIIPYCHNQNRPMYAYEFNGYWKDVGTLTSYWEANMELIDIVPDFNLYEEFWKIYTRSTTLPPQYFGKNSFVERSIIGEGSEIYGSVVNCVVGCGVTIGEGTYIHDSIIMNNVVIGSGCSFEKVIAAEGAVIGNGCSLGIDGDPNVMNETDPQIYRDGLVVIGENSFIPDNVRAGKNVLISGETEYDDYPGGYLASGKTLIKEDEFL